MRRSKAKDGSHGTAVVVLAAGKGERMKSERPKVLFDLMGWPLVRHVLETARALRPARTVVVTGYGWREVEAALAGEFPEGAVEFARQREQRGTGHAVRSAARTLEGHGGHVLVLLGDVPLVAPGTLRDLLTRHRRWKAAATILTMEVADPSGYGRIRRDDSGFAGIVEDGDAAAEDLAIREVNTGIMVFRTDALWSALRRLKADNAQGELYLTDVPGDLLRRGERVEAVLAPDSEEVRGVNSLLDLAEAAREARVRILGRHLESGVRIVDPASTYIEQQVAIGAGTTIFPFTVITGDVEIGEGCEVGPFSHLRSGTRLRAGAQIGNFVEVKKTVVGEGTKAKHLTYLGDAVIGAGTNIGCGTITANYDGRRKHPTTIGDGVHVGSGTVFVAPVTIGDGAVTGAGAIVLSGRNVKPGTTVAGVPARDLAAGKEER